jgi:hypothetical protein
MHHGLVIRQRKSHCNPTDALQTAAKYEQYAANLERPVVCSDDGGFWPFPQGISETESGGA